MNRSRFSLLAALALLTVGVAEIQAQPAPPLFTTTKYGATDMHAGLPGANFYDGSVLLLNFYEDQIKGIDYMDAVISGLRAPYSSTPAENVTFTTAFRNVKELSDSGPPQPVFDPLVGDLEYVYFSAMTADDFDNDGDLDLIVAGATQGGAPYQPLTRLYRNDGTGFTGVLDLEGVYKGSVDSGDYDNDGDADLLLTGVTDGGAFATLVYRNDGLDGFTPQLDAGLPGVGFGAGRWGDYDADGDLDVLLTGALPGGALLAAVYRNTGDGRFERAVTLAPGMGFSNALWFDLDDDGRLDVLLSGGVYSPFIVSGATRLYRNAGGDASGDDAFEPVAFDDPGFFGGDAAAGDFDDDGDTDLLISGLRIATGPYGATLFANDGGRFSEYFRVPAGQSLAFDVADFDRDYDLDILITGFNTEGAGLQPPSTQFYLRDGAGHNTPPSAPGDLSAAVQGASVMLEWNTASDDHTPTAALTYNVRVGRTPGGVEVVSPLAKTASGQRSVARRGNAGASPTFRLEGLAPGTYYWSVQALDAAYVGSPFAAEGSFTINTTSGGIATGTEGEAAASADPALAQNYPNPLHGHTAIRCTLPTPTTATVRLYDVRGRVVRTLWDGPLSAGETTLRWDGRTDQGTRAAPGVYLYRLRTADGYAQTRSLTVLP